MNRNSPVPLWAVLAIAVVLLGGVYVFAGRTVTPPPPSVIVRWPTATPQASVPPTLLPRVSAVAPAHTLGPALSLPSIPFASTSSNSNRVRDLELLYPRGREVFRTDETITIKNAVSPALKKKLKAADSVELYLLDSNDDLIGFIGRPDSASSEFAWDPQELLHNQGMDMAILPTPPGRYRLLLSARHPFIPGCTTCGESSIEDTLDGEHVQFTNGYVIDTSEVSPSPTELIASDVTVLPFELVR